MKSSKKQCGRADMSDERLEILLKNQRIMSIIKSVFFVILLFLWLFGAFKSVFELVKALAAAVLFLAVLGGPISYSIFYLLLKEDNESTLFDIIIGFRKGFVRNVCLGFIKTAIICFFCL